MFLSAMSDRAAVGRGELFAVLRGKRSVRRARERAGQHFEVNVPGGERARLFEVALQAVGQKTMVCLPTANSWV